MSSRFRYRELPHATVGVEALALTPDLKSGVGLTIAMSASEHRAWLGRGAAMVASAQGLGESSTHVAVHCSSPRAASHVMAAVAVTRQRSLVTIQTSASASAESKMALDLRSGMLRPATLHHAISKGTLSARSSLILRRATAQTSRALALGEAWAWWGRCLLLIQDFRLQRCEIPCCAVSHCIRLCLCSSAADPTGSLAADHGSRASHLQTATA